MRRWEQDLRPELERRGVAIVTVCTDPPEAIRRGHPRHGLKAIMLSDPDLEVTDLYGLRNRGFHSGPPRLRGLPVPTTILADREGIVRFVDRSENYQRRSDPARLLPAVERALDS